MSVGPYARAPQFRGSAAAYLLRLGFISPSPIS